MFVLQLISPAPGHISFGISSYSRAEDRSGDIREAIARELPSAQLAASGMRFRILGGGSVTLCCLFKA